MARTGRDTITIRRLATDAEVDALEVAEGRTIRRPHDIAEPGPRIRGMQALSPENDLRKILTLDIEANLEEFKAVSIDELTLLRESCAELAPTRGPLPARGGRWPAARTGG